MITITYLASNPMVAESSVVASNVENSLRPKDITFSHLSSLKTLKIISTPNLKIDSPVSNLNQI